MTEPYSIVRSAKSADPPRRSGQVHDCESGATGGVGAQGESFCHRPWTQSRGFGSGARRRLPAGGVKDDADLVAARRDLGA